MILTVSSSLSEPTGAASTAYLIPEIQSSLVGGLIISISNFSSSSDGLCWLDDGDDITTKDLVPPDGFSRASRVLTLTVLGYSNIIEL